MPPFYFGTNFKMHQTPSVTEAFIRDLRARTGDLMDVQLWVIPPYTSLTGAAPLVGENLWLGAQNMHEADAGEFTGEISPVMLKACGVALVMLGHAERRYKFGETDVALNRKLRAALAHGLRVLLCVGETATDKHYAVERETVARQLKIALHAVSPTDAQRVLVAYEPVWSIGEQGQPATVSEVQSTLEAIRDTLRDLYPAHHLPVVYGGSVNPENCATYAALPLLDGLFVGRAAREVDGFEQVLRLSLAARRTAT